MSPWYIVLFVMLQLATSMPTDSTPYEDSTLELTSTVESSNSSLPDFNVTTTESSTEPDDLEEDDVSYKAANETTTTEEPTTFVTTTTQEPTPTTVPSMANLVLPRAFLVFLVPACLHLFSKKSNFV